MNKEVDMRRLTPEQEQHMRETYTFLLDCDRNKPLHYSFQAGIDHACGHHTTYSFPTTNDEERAKVVDRIIELTNSTCCHGENCEAQS